MSSPVATHNHSNPFQIFGHDQLARYGSYSTSHGAFETPNFMPVATQGSVKGIDSLRLKELGAQIMLVNTYHLWLRPGPEIVAKLGGIHRFSGWSGPILSDSGGYQVYSLSSLRKLSLEGVEFRSHLDGSKQFLTPEKAISIQETLGVDIAMVLDECTASGVSMEQASKSLDLTIAWAKRCFAARSCPDRTKLFAITQGNIYPALRTRATEALSELSPDGIAIGGLSVGESKSATYDILAQHAPELPQDKIHYLMGVGTPADIVEAVRYGVDLFDCVMPTRAGRFGRAFLRSGQPYINIKNHEMIERQEPIELDCPCFTCQHYSKGYLSHLFRAKEMLGPILLSIHNLRHYLDLMNEIRSGIKSRTFLNTYNRVKALWSTEREQIENRERLENGA